MGKRLLLSSKHSLPLTCFFSGAHIRAPPPTPNATNPAPCYSSKTVAAAQNILIAAQLLLLSTGLSYTGVYRNTYLSVVSCLFVLCNTSQVAGIRGGKTAMQDGHFDRQSNRQFRDGWHKNQSYSTMMGFFLFIWGWGYKLDCVLACRFVCPLLVLSPGWSPVSAGDAVAVAAPRCLHTLSAASVPFIPVSQLTRSSQ